MAIKDRRDYSNAFFEQFALMPEQEQDAVIRTLQAVKRAVSIVRRDETESADLPLLTERVEA